VFEDALVDDGAEDFSMKVIEAEDSSTKELAVKDDETLTEKPLGQARSGETVGGDEAVTEAGHTVNW
jgi:hypothetical protein